MGGSKKRALRVSAVPQAQPSPAQPRVRTRKVGDRHPPPLPTRDFYSTPDAASTETHVFFWERWPPETDACDKNPGGG